MSEGGYRIKDLKYLSQCKNTDTRTLPPPPTHTHLRIINNLLSYIQPPPVPPPQRHSDVT